MDITVVDAGADDDDGLSGVATACHTLAGHENTSPTVPANGKRKHRDSAVEGSGDRQVCGGDHFLPDKPPGGTTDRRHCPLLCALSCPNLDYT